MSKRPSSSELESLSRRGFMKAMAAAAVAAAEAGRPRAAAAEEKFTIASTGGS